MFHKGLLEYVLSSFYSESHRTFETIGRVNLRECFTHKIISERNYNLVECFHKIHQVFRFVIFTNNTYGNQSFGIQGIAVIPLFKAIFFDHITYSHKTSMEVLPEDKASKHEDDN